MKALVFKKVRAPIAYEEVPKPESKKGQVLVALKAAAMNHREVWMTKGLYPRLKSEVIMGADGAGLVDKRAVVINPNVNWGDNPGHFSLAYSILGMPTNGTFAEYIVVDEDKVVDKPEHLTFEQAAALPLAGLTAYRVLMNKCKLKAGEKVLISGIGGGVALFAFQFALAAGAEVYVSSSSDEKIQKAIALGAKGGANYQEEKWHKNLGRQVGGFNVIIDSAAGDGLGKLASLAAMGGRIGIYGGTRGAINNLSPQMIFWKQLEIYGSTMGNDEEFSDMVDFVDQHKIVPVVDSVFELSDGNLAFKRMSEGLQFGKIVLRI